MAIGAIIVNFSKETQIDILKNIEINDNIQNIQSKKQGDIPLRYSQEMDLDKTYVYNVTYWEPGEIISYWDYNWADQGDINASKGGQIHVNFTGFYNKHPSDDNVFTNPVPYVNMSIYQNQSNSLVWNNTFYEVSSSEAGYVFGICYNTFRAGFLIPTNILNEIPQMAYMQDTEDWAACTVNVEEYDFILKIEFFQDSKWQNTSLIYDKKTGLLVWAKVETVSFFGSADFEIILNEYDLNFQKTQNYDQSDTEGFENVDIYVGNLEQGVSVFVGQYPVDIMKPFIKIVIEIDSSNWDLSIVLKDEKNNDILKLEEGNIGTSKFYAVFDTSLSTKAYIYIEGNYNPKTANSKSQAGSNYYIQAGKSSNYKNYIPIRYLIVEDEDDDDKEEKELLNYWIIILPIAALILINSLIIIIIERKKQR